MKLQYLLPLFLLSVIDIFSQVKFKVIGKKTDQKTRTSSNCNPIVEISGHKGTDTIAKKEIRGLGFLTVVNCDSMNKYKVISYELTLRIKGVPLLFKGTTSSVNLLKKSMNEVKEGGKIFIDNIKVKGLDGKILIAPKITLIVK